MTQAEFEKLQKQQREASIDPITGLPTTSGVGPVDMGTTNPDLVTSAVSTTSVLTEQGLGVSPNLSVLTPDINPLVAPILSTPANLSAPSPMGGELSVLPRISLSDPVPPVDTSNLSAEADTNGFDSPPTGETPDTFTPQPLPAGFRESDGKDTATAVDEMFRARSRVQPPIPEPSSPSILETNVNKQNGQTEPLNAVTQAIPETQQVQPTIGTEPVIATVSTPRPEAVKAPVAEIQKREEASILPPAPAVETPVVIAPAVAEAAAPTQLALEQPPVQAAASETVAAPGISTPLVEHVGEITRVEIPAAAQNHMTEVGEPKLQADTHQQLEAAHPDHAQVTGEHVSPDTLPGNPMVIDTGTLGAWGNLPDAVTPFKKPKITGIIGLMQNRLAKKAAHEQQGNSDSHPRIFKLDGLMSFISKIGKKKSSPTDSA